MEGAGRGEHTDSKCCMRYIGGCISTVHHICLGGMRGAFEAEGGGGGAIVSSPNAGIALGSTPFNIGISLWARSSSFKISAIIVVVFLTILYTLFGATVRAKNG